MIISSGQILTGRAAAVITNGITNAKDAHGYVRTSYKALCVPDSMPEANLGAPDVLGNREPVLDWGASRTYQIGDVMTIERNGMISVLAGDTIKEGDYLKLGDNGTFVPGAKSDNIGRAYESAAAGERFEAYINAL